MLAILPLILGLAPEIARWIGGDQAAGVTSAVTSAVKTITGTENPEDAARTLAADPAKAAELRLQLAKIAADAEAAQRAAELESLKLTLDARAKEQQTQLDAMRASIADIGSARELTTNLAKSRSPLAWGAPVLSLVIVIAFAIILYVVLHLGVREESLALGNVLVGTLAAMATQVANFWLGSSSGSKGKDEALLDAQSKLADSVPANFLPHPSAVVPAATVSDGGETDSLNRASLIRARAR